MKKNSGMTLIELIVYLALFTFIAMASISFITRFWQTSMQYQKRQVSLINLMAAHDLLCNDIRHAPRNKTAWKMRHATELIWQRQDGIDIGWLYENEALFRSEGLYNEKEGIWHKRTKNLVAPALQKVLFTCHGNEDIAWVDFSLIDAYHTIDARVILLQQLMQGSHGEIT